MRAAVERAARTIASDPRELVGALAGAERWSAGTDECVRPQVNKTRPQRRAISIIEIPMMFRTSTLSKSDQGAHPQAIRNSCRRKRSPKAKISAPRRNMVRVITDAGRFLRISLSVTRAKEIPARNRKSGAGRVPRSCEVLRKVVLRASPPSQAS